MKAFYSRGPSRKSRFRPRRPGEERASEPLPGSGEGDAEQEHYEQEPGSAELYAQEQEAAELYAQEQEAAELYAQEQEAAELYAQEQDAVIGQGPSEVQGGLAAVDPGAFDAQAEPATYEPGETLSDPNDRPSPMARPRGAFTQERYVYTSPYAIPWLRPLLWGALVVAGGAGGYFIGLAGKSVPVAKPAPKIPTIRMVERPPPLTVDERQQLDQAYESGREGRYSQSAQLFGALTQKHRLWTKVPLEIARMDIYQADYIGAQKILGDLMQGDTDARADAFFLSGVLNLKAQNFPDAEIAFAAATDADPTRSEYYYFWGDCLRQEGKPQEARTRFLSALYRNQYETAEDLLQLKVWLCDITSDQEKTDGASAAINAALAAPFPRAAALLAAAARSMKVDRFNEAASFIARGRAAMDQVVFNVVLHDPTFFQESWRPEFGQFYAAEGAPAPAGTPAPTASLDGAR